MARVCTINNYGVFRDGVAVSPADSDLAVPCSAVYVGTQGTLVVSTFDGTTVTLANAFGLIPLACLQIRTTGTTAQNIVALY